MRLICCRLIRRVTGLRAEHLRYLRKGILPLLFWSSRNFCSLFCFGIRLIQDLPQYKGGVLNHLKTVMPAAVGVAIKFFGLLSVGPVHPRDIRAVDSAKRFGEFLKLFVQLIA